MRPAKQTKQYFPAEWAVQQAVVVGFPSHQALWLGSLLSEAQQEVAALCNLLAETQTCYALVANPETELIAKKMLTGETKIIRFNFGDIWFRDIAPIFKNPSKAVRFKHNGWGGKYIYQYDDSAAERLAALFNLECEAFDFVLEGGALEHNGEGAILTTRQCLLNQNRNAWNLKAAETQLKNAFNASHIYWLNQGLAYDHTDGHIDNIARFVNAKKVLCQRATGNDDPNANVYARHLQEIIQQGLEVISIPSPGLIKDPDGDVMPASHLNFVISNERVIFPNYLKYSFAEQRCVGETQEILSELFGKREIVTLPANAILTGGGSFHCISQHIPL